MITYNEAFNDGYEQALEEMGYVIDDREYVSDGLYDLDSFIDDEYDTYAEEGLYDLDSFIDDDSAYENYDIDEAYYNGYYDDFVYENYDPDEVYYDDYDYDNAMEALKLFKKKDTAEVSTTENEGIGRKILNGLKNLVQKVAKFLTETMPNFFKNLFKSNPDLKNDEKIKDLNNQCNDLNKRNIKATTILKAFGVALGAVGVVYAGGHAVKFTTKNIEKLKDTTNGLLDAFGSVKENVDNVKQNIAAAPGKAKDAFVSGARKVKEGVKKKGPELINSTKSKASSFFNAASDRFKNFVKR